MSKYKAPWLYIKEQGMVYDNMGEIVCSTMPTGEQWEEDNAALIERAPDVLEMLKRCKVEILDLDGTIFDERGTGKYYEPEIISDIDELLAKTRGKHESI